MKRDEIKPGEEYLVARADNWDSPRRSHMTASHIERVRVLDNEPWAKQRFGRDSTKIHVETATGPYDVPESLTPVATGNGVLVEVLDKASGERANVRNSFRVVQANQIRGPWQSSWERLEKNIAEERAKIEAVDAETEAMNRKAALLAKALGGTSNPRSMMFGSYPSIVLTVEQAEALVHQLPTSDTGGTATVEDPDTGPGTGDQHGDVNGGG